MIEPDYTPKTLDNWLRGQPKGAAKKMAAACGASQSHFCQARLGLRRVRLNWMPVIELFTQGAVTVPQLLADAASRERKVTNRRRR